MAIEAGEMSIPEARRLKGLESETMLEAAGGQGSPPPKVVAAPAKRELVWLAQPAAAGALQRREARRPPQLANARPTSIRLSGFKMSGA